MKKERRKDKGMKTTENNKKNIGIKRTVNAGFLPHPFLPAEAVFLIPFL